MAGEPVIPLLAPFAVPSGYWLAWLGMILVGFAVPEGYSIATKQNKGTLSANIRSWLKTDTPGGGATWLVVWLHLAAVLVWLLGHILRWWP